MRNLLDNHYINPKLAAVYDHDSGWSVDRQFYLDLAHDPQMKILDVGCGTGMLCLEYARRNHKVTGIDPSPAMLEVARKKDHDDKVEWIESCAQDFDLKKLFDLIIMTGHAFQVLHTDEDLAAAFENMQKHLESDGRIVFETRNPAIDWSNKWNYEMELVLTDGVTVKESRRFMSMTENILSFELLYQFPDQLLSSTSALRFWSKDEIEKGANAAGLHVEKLSGDWTGNEFDINNSEEMIFFMRKMSEK